MSEKASLERWKKEYNFIKGYATKNKMRNTVIALTLAVNIMMGNIGMQENHISYIH